MGDITKFVEHYIEVDSHILEEETNNIAISLESNIKRETPYLQGRLRRSIRVDSRLFQHYSLITGYWDEGLAPHGIFVLDKTDPHVIRAKNKKALKTPFGLFKKVNHPGTKANDFLGRGLEKTLENYR